MKLFRVIAPIAAVTAALFLNGCVEELTGNEEVETAPTAVKVAFPKNSPIQKIACRGELYVTADDFDTLWGNARVDSSGFYGELTKIPVGENRTFGVSVYDSLNMLRYHGENVADIHAGTNNPLHITLNRVTESGTVVVIGEINEGTEPDTTIIWMGDYPEHPANPELYWGYHNTTDGNFYLFNGTEWEIIKDMIVDTPKLNWLGSYTYAPHSPKVNDAYFNILENCSYIFDGNSWSIFSRSNATQAGLSGISVIWLGAFHSSPADPEKEWTYYNTTTKATYRFDGAQWETIAVDQLDPVDFIIDSVIVYDTIEQRDTSYILNGVTLSDSLSSVLWLGVLDSFPENSPERSVFFHSLEYRGFGYNNSQWSAYTDEEFQVEINSRIVVNEYVVYDTLYPTVCIEK